MAAVALSLFVTASGLEGVSTQRCTAAALDPASARFGSVRSLLPKSVTGPLVPRSAERREGRKPAAAADCVAVPVGTTPGRAAAAVADALAVANGDCRVVDSGFC